MVILRAGGWVFEVVVWGCFWEKTAAVGKRKEKKLGGIDVPGFSALRWQMPTHGRRRHKLLRHFGLAFFMKEM